MKKEVAVIAALLAAAICSYAMAEGFNTNVTTKGLSFRDHVYGPAVKESDLAGHVVLVEFWGVNCGPCRESMPLLSKWSDKHSGDGLIVIGIHTQSATNTQIEELCRQRGVTYSIYAQGDVKGGMDFNGIPHVFLFDHTGQCIFRGHPMEVYEKVKDALAKAPAAMLAGRELVKLKSLSEGMKKGMTPAAALKAAGAQVNSEDADLADEAKFVVESITTWGKKQVEGAKAGKDTEPLRSYNTLQKIAKDFAGTDIEKDASATLAELKADEQFMKEVKAWQALDKLKELEKQVRPIRAWDGPDIYSDKFKKKNAVVLGQIYQGVQMMRKNYPKCEATVEAVTIAEKYGMIK